MKSLCVILNTDSNVTIYEHDGQFVGYRLLWGKDAQMAILIHLEQAKHYPNAENTFAILINIIKW